MNTYIPRWGLLMLKRIPGWISGAFLLALCLLVIYASGCKEGNNSTPLSMTISGLGPTGGVLDVYTGSFSISGYLKNNGIPLINFPVELLVGETIISNPAMTTGDGQFFFTGLAPALYTIRVGHGSATYTEMLYPVYIDSEGHQSPSAITVPIEEKNPKVVTATGTIEAFVIDSLNNKPVSLATVSLALYTDGVSTNLNKRTLTDGSGYFSFSNITPGLYMLSISKAGYVTQEYPVNILVTGAMTPSKPTIPLTLVEVPQTILGTITGIVKLNTTGELLPEIHIRAINSATQKDVAGSPRRTTTEGKFNFDNLPPGEYTIIASGTLTGFNSVIRTCYIRDNGAADPVSTDLVLSRVTEPFGSIFGYVKLDTTGEALAEITVSLIGDKIQSSCKTTSEGKYAFDNLSPGEYTVIASGTAYGYNTATRTCYIRADGTPDPASTNHILSRYVAPKGSISGYVKLDTTGEVVPEISVTAVNTATNQQVAGSSRITTSEGKFTFDNLPPGEYTISASQVGFVEVTRTCYIKSNGEPDPASTDLVISRSVAAASNITGYVKLNTTGAALPEIRITLKSSSVLQTTKTTSEGKYIFENLYPAEYTIVADGTEFGYDIATRTCYIRSNGAVDPAVTQHVLTQITSIIGKITGYVKLAGGTILPQIQVSLKVGGVEKASCITTSEGKFTFDNLHPGEYTITASDSAYTPVTRTTYIRDTGASDPTSTDIVLTPLREKPLIEGQVIDSTTRVGIDLASVSVELYVGNSWTSLGKMTYTNGAGQFSFVVDNAGLYKLTVEKSEYTIQRYTVTVNDDSTLSPAAPTILLTKVSEDKRITGNISGYVKLDTTNTALAEILITVIGKDGEVDGSPKKTTADGKFIFENLPIGQYTIIASGTSTGYTSATRSCYILNNGTADPLTTNITLSLISGNISGIVYAGVDPTDDPLPNISISVKDSTNKEVTGSPKTTTADGKYVFAKLPPGDYTVTANGTSSGYETLVKTCTISNTGTAPTTDFKLSLVPKTGNISGFVRLDTGVALPEISVSVKKGAADVAGSPMRTTGEGKFLFANLPEGIYTVNASGTGYTSVTRTTYIYADGSVSPTTTNITLARDPAYSGKIIGYVFQDTAGVAFPEVEITIADPDGDPVTNISGQTVGTLKTTSEGKFVIENLLPGQYAITATHVGYTSLTRTCYILTNGTADPATTNILLVP